MTMERKTIYKNLFAFASKRPPCVVFVIFLSFFAFGFFALGYYIQHNNIVDTTASQGWNRLYSKLSSLTFCLNASEANNKTSITEDKAFQVYDDMVNISLPFELTVRPLPGVAAVNASHLAGIIPYLYLKFGDFFLNESPIWIGLEQGTLLGPCIIEENQLGGFCRTMTYVACVTVTLPKVFVPIVKPNTCNGTIAENQASARITILGPDFKNGKVRRSTCVGQFEMSMTKQSQYDSEVLLSISEKTQLNLRLQLAGYFLFVLLLSLLLYATIKGRHLKL